MRNKFIVFLTSIILCLTGLCFVTPVFASTGNDNLTVNTAWVEGDKLRINVTDNLTGANSVLELRLQDYTVDSEYITIQAMDFAGNKSGLIQIKNPYYKPPNSEKNTETSAETTTEVTTSDTSKDKPSEETESTSTAPTKSDQNSDEKGFTPDGTGSVMDNVVNSEGKEFFTVKTADENVFYLIIDRERKSDNVYLLNAVTENDLLALSKKGNGGISAIPTDEPKTPQQQPEQTPNPEPEKETKPTANDTNLGTFIFIGIAMLITGGAGYYFKIYKPKKQAPESDDYDMEFEDELENEETAESDNEDDKYLESDEKEDGV